MVGFWVQRMGIILVSPVIQMLQPIHSRISSRWFSLILFGRKGSAIEGRAAPIMSSTPRRTAETIESGEV